MPPLIWLVVPASLTMSLRDVLHWLPVLQRIQFKIALRLQLLTVSVALVHPISGTSAFQWLTSLADQTDIRFNV